MSEVSGAEAMVAFLRDAGLVGASILFILGLISRKIVLGWQYDEERKRADREQDRADRAEELLEKITTAADRSTVVTEQMVRRQSYRLSGPEPEIEAPDPVGGGQVR